MATEVGIDKVLDASGELCPMPVIEAQLAIKAMKSGQVLKLIATDPGAKRDVPSWAKVAGHKLLEAKEEGKALVFLVQRG